MIGVEISSLSSTIAKLPANWSASAGAMPWQGWPVAWKQSSAPRIAISRVTSWKFWRPSSVNPKLTTGWLNWSKSGFGSVISSPESPGLSLRTKNSAGSVSDSSISVSGSSSAFCSSTTVPRGTSSSSVFGGSSPSNWAFRSSSLSAGSPIGSIEFSSNA